MVTTSLQSTVGVSAASLSAKAFSGAGSQASPAFLLLDAGEAVARGARLAGPKVEVSLTPSRIEAPAATFAGLVPWARQPRAAQTAPNRRRPQTKRPAGNRPGPQRESERHHA